MQEKKCSTNYDEAEFLLFRVAKLFISRISKKKFNVRKSRLRLSWSDLKSHRIAHFQESLIISD